jgi:hypothetical protein
MRWTPASLVLLGVLACSALLHWLAVRSMHGPWIVPDEVIYGLRAYTVWHDGPASLLHGAGAGYGLLYPVVAGVPLSLGRTTQSYTLLKAVQPVVVSLAVIPVFAYCRRLMPARWALVAAGLTAASPLLLYSGFVMTEVLFYPLAALTLFAIARAVESGSSRDQAIAVLLVVAAALTRSQAVVFAFVLPAAAVVEAAMSRNPRRLRLFWPSIMVLALGVAAVGLVPGLVGAYGQTLRGSYPLHAALGLVLDHLAFAAVLVGVLPAAALVVLALDAFRGAERSPAARALIAVTLVTVAVLSLQVGFFAARYSPHLLGRDLTPLPPPLFAVFALWLARGAPRRFVLASVGVYALLALLLLTPWDRLVTPEAFADSFDLIVISKLPWSPLTSLMLFSVVVLLAFLALPRRLAVVVLPAITLATLVASSAVAARDLRNAASVRRLDLVGATPNWIDRAAVGPVAYVYGGEELWTAVWQERFWNRRINEVITLGGARVPGPMPQSPATLPVDGALPTRDEYVVAPDRFAIAGTRVAHLTQVGLDISGLTLWRVDGRPRISFVTNHVLPNGDMTHPATVSIYDCRGGSLELTLLPKATHRLRIRLDGRVVVDRRISGESWSGAIPVPVSRRPRRCVFTIFPDPLLGSTRIAFVRP